MRKQRTTNEVGDYALLSGLSQVLKLSRAF
jgi:hypothetical protein